MIDSLEPSVDAVRFWSVWVLFVLVLKMLHSLLLIKQED